VKKTISLILSLIMVISICGINAFAVDETASAAEKTGIAVFEFDEAALLQQMQVAATSSSTKNLTKDFVSTSATGTVYTIGQYVDFSSLPGGAKI
jgi:hypothetical protein